MLAELEQTIETEVNYKRPDVLRNQEEMDAFCHLLPEADEALFNVIDINLSLAFFYAKDCNEREFRQCINIAKQAAIKGRMYNDYEEQFENLEFEYGFVAG